MMGGLGESSGGSSALAMARPTTGDGGYDRARQLLRDRITNRPCMRAPGATRPDAEFGIGLSVAEFSTMGSAYVKQYVHASLAVLRRHELDQRLARQQRADAAGHASQGGGGSSRAIAPVEAGAAGGDDDDEDVFTRAEHPQVKELPLLSRGGRERQCPTTIPLRIPLIFESGGRLVSGVRTMESVVESHVTALEYVGTLDRPNRVLETS